MGRGGGHVDQPASNLQILRALAERLGCRVRFKDRPREVFDELRAASAGGLADYAGIAYDPVP